MEKSSLLFVYGTLRRGGRAASRMAGCTWLGLARLNGALYDLGSYPALTLDGTDTIEGELWRCSPETLARLDAYEGVDEGLFERVRVELEAGECWTYVAGPALRYRLARAAQRVTPRRVL